MPGSPGSREPALHSPEIAVMYTEPNCTTGVGGTVRRSASNKLSL